MSVNLKDLWKIAKTQNKPLLGTSTDLATLDFMEDYLSKYEGFDRDIARNKGFFFPLWNRNEEDTDQDVFDQWQKDVFYFLYKNKENYQRLYDLLSIEYDPLTNYDKHSYITENDDGEDKVTDILGARHSEDDYAQKQLTDSYGAVSETDVNGQKITTSEDSIAGFNSAQYSDAGKNETTDGSQTNTHTELAKIDTHTEGSHKDQHDTNSATDTHTTEFGKEHYYDEHTSGNIGVTTSQQMAQSEIDLWNSFKFYDILINDIIKELCTFYGEGYDCF